MSDPSEIVGHKTFSDGAGGFRHEPLTRAEGDAIWAAVEARREARAKAMPTEEDAVRAMFEAYYRLKELGWEETMYRSNADLGSQRLIEPGSAGIHVGHYDGEWPTGTWWIESEGDLWPSHPCLAKSARDEGNELDKPR